MSNTEQKVGGASITPSARPSIHSHRGACAFRDRETANLCEREKMVRYGLNNPERNNRPNDQGRDEVDNVLSKLARAPSPLAARRCPPKRNSFDGSAHLSFTSEEGFRDTHSKSLPSSFLSHSYCSDELNELQWSSETTNNSTESFRNLNLGNERNESQEREHEQLANILRDESRNRRTQNVYRNYSQSSSSSPEIDRSLPARGYEHQRERPTSQGSQNPKYLLGILGSVSLVLALYAGDYLPINASDLSSITSNQYNTDKFYSDLNYIGEKHNLRDDSILQLQTAISTILKNQDSGSFILAYNSNKINFDQDGFDFLVNFIASTASKYLRNDSTSVQHIVVDGSNLQVRSHSELLTKYRDDITKNGVMLVREVDKVPSTLAMAFHYYCDEFNPVVKKSAIFFTLDMTKCYSDSVEQKATHGQIEKCLRRKWNGVPPDNINPLLNRVVNTIVDVAGK